MNLQPDRTPTRGPQGLLLRLAGRRRIKTLWDGFFLLLGLAAAVLGFVGFARYGYGSGDSCTVASLSKAFLKTAQLFVLESSWDELCHWSTRWAAFMAPVATVGGALAAFGPRVNRWLESWVLRWRPASDVFIGGGDLAAGVAMSLAEGTSVEPDEGEEEAPPTKLVGLDLRDETPLGQAMESFCFPCFVRKGDALSTHDLQELRLHSARRIWIATGDDHRNLEVARRVLKLIDGHKRIGGKPANAKLVDAHGDKSVHLMVSVYDQDQVRAKKVMYPLLEASPATMDFFSLPRLAARVLWRRHPPPLCEGIAPPHILIVGTSDLAAALLVYAAQLGVYDEHPANCIRITLAGPSATALHERLLCQFPALAPSSPDPMLKLLLPLAHIQSVDADEDKLSLVQWQQLQSQQAFSAVYVACERDLDSVSAAIRMASLRELDTTVQPGALPIVACIQQPRGSLCAVTSGELHAQLCKQASPWLHLFDVYAECILRGEAYPGAKQDGWAMVVKAAYDHGNQQAPFRATGPGLKQAVVRWNEQTNEDFRWSNRLSADHINLKLDLIAGRSTLAHSIHSGEAPLQNWRTRLKDGKAAELADELEAVLQDNETFGWLLRLEHRRFVADRLMGGWLPLPSDRRGEGASGLSAEEQKRELRLNHTLVPFDTLVDRARQNLAEDERKKDERIVQAIPEILRAKAAFTSDAQSHR